MRCLAVGLLVIAACGRSGIVAPPTGELDIITPASASIWSPGVMPAFTYPVGFFKAKGSPVLTGLAGWFKADAGITLAGSNVLTWADQIGGSTHNWTGAGSGGSAGPTNPSNAQNGHPVIRCNGSQGMSNVANWLSGVTVGEIWVVLRSTAAMGAANNGLWTFGTHAAAASYPFSDDNIYDGWGITTRPGFTGGTPSRVFSIYRVVLNNTTSWTTYLNGIQQFTAAETPGFASTLLLCQGGVYDWLGDFAEIMIYTGATLNTTQANQNTTYLRTRWATP